MCARVCENNKKRKKNRNTEAQDIETDFKQTLEHCQTATTMYCRYLTI